ncbi:MAG: hypothetical protein M0R80_01095 [Proteobacteria bacterium]|jgi:hypothetical protein|nr:hypothetical protein [Pseudomonadota bacterium]
MNLDDCTKSHLIDLGEHAMYVILKVCPNLHDVVVLHHNGEYQDIDFYFKDDPRKDEEGYLGCGIEEFTMDSETYDQLATITNIICACLGVK